MNMTPPFLKRMSRWLMLGVLLCGMVLTLPSMGTAAPDADRASVRRQVAARPVVAAYWDEILGDRTRMIQVSLIVVAIGIGFLMWGKSK